MVPINMRFDSVANILNSNIVRMPKLNEGAPYSFGFRIRFEDDTYRDFSEDVEMRWRIKLRPTDSEDLMVLYKSAGNFVVSTEEIDNDTLNFVIKASDWDTVVLPRSPNHMEMEVPFAFVVEVLDQVGVEGVVVERFAQGSGFISIDLMP